MLQPAIQVAGLARLPLAQILKPGDFLLIEANQRRQFLPPARRFQKVEKPDLQRHDELGQLTCRGRQLCRHQFAEFGPAGIGDSQPIALGRWRYSAIGVVALFGAATVILPAFTLGWLSLLPPYSAPILGTGAPLTFGIYVDMFTDPRNATIVWNTIVMLAATATITMGIAFLVSWAIVRGTGGGRGLLDGMSFLPYAFPGVTVGQRREV